MITLERLCGFVSVVRETHLFDVDADTGEITQLSSSRMYRGSMLGDGYIVVYKRALEGLLEKGASYTALRIYLKLMSLQNFGAKVVIQNKYVYENLGICRNAYYTALNWLVDNGFVKKDTENGMNAFILNPKHTTCGTASLKKRNSLWSMTAEELKQNAAEEMKRAAKQGAIVKNMNEVLPIQLG